MAKLESQHNLYEKTTKVQIDTLGEQMSQLKNQLKNGFSPSPQVIKTLSSAENVLHLGQQSSLTTVKTERLSDPAEKISQKSDSTIKEQDSGASVVDTVSKPHTSSMSISFFEK